MEVCVLRTPYVNAQEPVCELHDYYQTDNSHLVVVSAEQRCALFRKQAAFLPKFLILSRQLTCVTSVRELSIFLAQFIVIGKLKIHFPLDDDDLQIMNIEITRQTCMRYAHEICRRVRVPVLVYVYVYVYVYVRVRTYVYVFGLLAARAGNCRISACHVLKHVTSQPCTSNFGALKAVLCDLGANTYVGYR